MEPVTPSIIRAAEAAPSPGPPTPGMDRRQLLEHDDRWFGWVRTDAGTDGGWHHHGDRDSYVYVLRGAVRIDFGPGGREHVEAARGISCSTRAGWCIAR